MNEKRAPDFSSGARPNSVGSDLVNSLNQDNHGSDNMQDMPLAPHFESLNVAPFFYSVNSLIL
jgi:hypothetical protein